MARLARIVVPGLPHHVTQRGNRRETVFFGDDDYQAYLDLLATSIKQADSEIWAWCLMPNHIHMIVVPSSEDGLRQTVANAHRRYAARINARNKWTGHLWQGRFGSVIMDETHLYNAIAYVCLNPVRARLVKKASDWKWSSVHAHLNGRDDGITTRSAVRERIDDFADYLTRMNDDSVYEPLRRSEIVGRPIGSPDFIKSLEQRTGRVLQARKRGPMAKVENTKK
ncbi:MAG: transposase [Hyphomonadaceae bacterium]|nr:transposase [Hyphomonadaceae bacterium]